MSQDLSPYVQFNEDLAGNVGSTASVDVSIDGGQTWTTVWQNSGYPGKPGPDLETVPLPMAAGQSQVQVRFHYVTKVGTYWAIDNVFIGNRACAPIPGGLVEGIVKDGNTGAGVDGATVTSVSNPSNTATTAPTGDPAISDGFYYMFVPGSGSQQFTAAKTPYATATGTATVTAGAAAPLDMTMKAGQLSVTPGSVSSSIGMGGRATQNLTFKDTGQEPVNVKLYHQPGGFTMLGQPSGATGAPLQRVKGTFSPLSAAKAPKPAGTAPKSAAQPYDAPWTTVANYPTAIMDNAVATDPATGLVYSVGGVDGSGNATAAGYVYNPGSRQWTALPPMQNTRQAPQAAFINGKLYVTGGWDMYGNTVATTEIYDPATGTWSTGASIPNAYAGASVAVLNGEMYVIGGCDDYNCGHSDVQVYNPASNSWSAAASYPTSISWEGCGAIGTKIYCAGGDTSSSSDTSDAYVYNPRLDSWSPIAPMPIDLWGMGYTAANGKLLLSGGVTGGFTTITNQGYAYDPSSGSWTALPNSNNADYRGGSGCGLYRIGGATGGPQDFAEQLPGYSTCGSSDAPWLSESQDQLTLNPGQQATVTVTLNGGDASVTQPGAYTTGLQVSDDTPYTTSPVNVTMNVTPPKTWGKIIGTVSGKACAGTTGPLKGADVQIDGKVANYTLKTDSKGQYAYWINASDNPLTATVSQDGWQSQTNRDNIKAGATVSANFTLSPISC